MANQKLDTSSSLIHLQRIDKAFKSDNDTVVNTDQYIIQFGSQ
jgi:hypothetical protein